MNKSFPIIVLLLLFCSYSDQVEGQASSTKNQPFTNIKNPIAPTSTVMSLSEDGNAKATELYEEGMKLTEAGQLSQAVEDFQQALRLRPEFADAYAALGRAYFKMREWQKAVDNFRRAGELKTKPRELQSDLQLKPSIQRREETKTSEDSLSKNSQTKVQQQTNANAAEVKTLVRKVSPLQQQREEANSQVKASSTSAQVKPAPTNPQVTVPQRTNANGASVKTLNPKTEATQQPQETGTPLRAVAPNPSTKQQRTAKADNTEVKTPNAETQQSEEPPANVSPFKNDGDNDLDQKQQPVGLPVALNVAPASKRLENRNLAPIPTEALSDEASLTKIYRVGPNDVLDIRLNDSDSTHSTLFTVTASGLLEFPMLAEPLPVTGLTADEIETKLANDLKTRALVDDPKVMVGVRDYASHTILVSGLVKDAGTKFLRREAIPLYVVVADAQPLPEAATVSVIRNEIARAFEIDLTQTADMNFLVRPGDVITVHPSVVRFIYIGGEIKFPGEKTYRRGLTLMQAILAAGGVTPKSKIAEIGRDDGRGFLVATRCNLKDIESGKVADPLLQPGDRIMIQR